MNFRLSVSGALSVFAALTAVDSANAAASDSQGACSVCDLCDIAKMKVRSIPVAHPAYHRNQPVMTSLATTATDLDRVTTALHAPIGYAVLDEDGDMDH